MLIFHGGVCWWRRLGSARAVRRRRRSSSRRRRRPISEGRRREPVDRQPRPADARSGDRARVRNVGAVSLVDGGAVRRHAVRRHRQRGQGLSASTRRARGRCSSTARELEVHALAPAPNGGMYVGTSPDGKIYKVDRNGNATPFFSSEDKYIWALAVDAQGQPVRSDRRKGDHLQDHAGRQRRAVLQDQRDARHGPRLRQSRQSPGRHGHAREGAAARPGRRRRSCCSIRRSRKSALSDSTTRGSCTSRP